MAIQHIRLDQQNPVARFTGDTMPRLEFRQALFRTPLPGWHKRLYRAALVVTTTAHGLGNRTLVVDHQVMRFAVLYNDSWPEPHFPQITRWPYEPVELKENTPVTHWTIDLRLRELRLGPEEWVEFIFIG